MSICDIPRKLAMQQAFINHIKAVCIVDEADGQLYCKLCKNKVVVDWFEQNLECQGCDEL